MKQIIDLENWNRKEHFDFFSAMEEPCGELQVP